MHRGHQMRGIQNGEKSDFEAQGATKQHAVHAVHAGCLLHLAPRCKRGKSGALPVPPREKLALLPLCVCDFDRSELREIFFGAHGSARDQFTGANPLLTSYREISFLAPCTQTLRGFNVVFGFS